MIGLKRNKKLEASNIEIKMSSFKDIKKRAKKVSGTRNALKDEMIKDLYRRIDSTRMSLTRKNLLKQKSTIKIYKGREVNFKKKYQKTSAWLNNRISSYILKSVKKGKLKRKVLKTQRKFLKLKKPKLRRIKNLITVGDIFDNMAASFIPVSRSKKFGFTSFQFPAKFSITSLEGVVEFRKWMGIFKDLVVKLAKKIRSKQNLSTHSKYQFILDFGDTQYQSSFVLIENLQKKLNKNLRDIPSARFPESLIINTLNIPRGGGVGSKLYNEEIQRFSKKSVVCVKGDGKCAIRAICCGIQYVNYTQGKITKSQYKNYNKKGRIKGKQDKDVRKLMGRCNVKVVTYTDSERGIDLDDIVNIETYIKKRIIIYSAAVHGFSYRGNKEFKQHLYLLKCRNHYDCITDMKKFLGGRQWCEKCLKTYTEQHTCNGVTLYDRKKCRKCGSLDGKTHKCGVKNCGLCGKKYESLQNHECFISKKKPKKRTNNLIYADFEAEQRIIDGVYKHIPNYCVAKYRDGETFKFHDCGNNVTDKFCSWLIHERNKGHTVLFHNAKGYDSMFIVNWLCKFSINTNEDWYCVSPKSRIN